MEVLTTRVGDDLFATKPCSLKRLHANAVVNEPLRKRVRADSLHSDSSSGELAELAIVCLF